MLIALEKALVISRRTRHVHPASASARAYGSSLAVGGRQAPPRRPGGRPDRRMGGKLVWSSTTVGFLLHLGEVGRTEGKVVRVRAQSASEPS